MQLSLESLKHRWKEVSFLPPRGWNLPEFSLKKLFSNPSLRLQTSRVNKGLSQTNGFAVSALKSCSPFCSGTSLAFGMCLGDWRNFTLTSHCRLLFSSPDSFIRMFLDQHASWGQRWYFKISSLCLSLTCCRHSMNVLLHSKLWGEEWNGPARCTDLEFLLNDKTFFLVLFNPLFPFSTWLWQ